MCLYYYIMPEIIESPICFSIVSIQTIRILFYFIRLMFGHFIKHNHLCIFCNLHAASNKQLPSRSIAASSFKSKNHSFFSLDFNAQKKQNILAAICLFVFNGPLCVCFFALTSVYVCVSE